MGPEGSGILDKLNNSSRPVARSVPSFFQPRWPNVSCIEALLAHKQDVQYHRLNPDVVTYSHVMAAVREAVM